MERRVFLNTRGDRNSLDEGGGVKTAAAATPCVIGSASARDTQGNFAKLCSICIRAVLLSTLISLISPSAGYAARKDWIPWGRPDPEWHWLAFPRQMPGN